MVWRQMVDDVCKAGIDLTVFVPTADGQQLCPHIFRLEGNANARFED